MAIVARGGAAYARLQFRVGPGGAWEIPVEIDFAQPFAAADQAAWKRNYDALVEAEPEFDPGGDLEPDSAGRLALSLRRMGGCTRWGFWSSIASIGRAAWCRRSGPLQNTWATVIGCGSIGRQVALQLTAMGIPKLQLIDFDEVVRTNITSQGFLTDDVGRPKVEAVGDSCHQIEHLLAVEEIKDRYRPSQEIGPNVFCCVDSISAREPRSGTRGTAL